MSKRSATFFGQVAKLKEREAYVIQIFIEIDGESHSFETDKEFPTLEEAEDWFKINSLPLVRKICLKMGLEVVDIDQEVNVH